MLTLPPLNNNLCDFQDYQIMRAIDEVCPLEISIFGYSFNQQKQIKIVLNRRKTNRDLAF